MNAFIIYRGLPMEVEITGDGTWILWKSADGTEGDCARSQCYDSLEACEEAVIELSISRLVAVIAHRATRGIHVRPVVARVLSALFT